MSFLSGQSRVSQEFIWFKSRVKSVKTHHYCCSRGIKLVSPCRPTAATGSREGLPPGSAAGPLSYHLTRHRIGIYLITESPESEAPDHLHNAFEHGRCVLFKSFLAVTRFSESPSEIPHNCRARSGILYFSRRRARCFDCFLPWFVWGREFHLCWERNLNL